MAAPLISVIRMAQPRHPVRINPSNRFGARARIFLYPLNDRYLYDACNGQTYRVGVGGIPTIFGNAVRGGSATVMRTAFCPPDLLNTKQQTMVMLLHGRAAAWITNKGMRLIDNSSNLHFEFRVQHSSSTVIIMRAFSQGDVGAPNLNVTANSLAALTAGLVNDGANGVRFFVARPGESGRMVGTDTVTADAAQAGTDTRVEVGGSTGTNVDYSGMFWLAGALNDGEMAEFMRNPWQALMPIRVAQSSAAAAATFNAAWNIAANTLIQPGAVVL